MKPYNDYNSYLKQKYGCKVYRIGIDAGFTCPNRDGSKGSGGCIYCNAGGSRASYADPEKTVSRQLARRVDYLKKTKKADKFIAYFQAFTNTYAPIDKLKAVYDEVLPFKEVVGISIGTRPDAVDESKLALIASYKKNYEVGIEYGLQSMHNETLRKINRGHTYEDFLEALALTGKFNIPVCVHVILGLPNETRSDIIETAKALSSLKVEAVKIHSLHVLKGSPLERSHKEGGIQLLSQEEYAEMACDFLEHLSENIIIQRLTGQGNREDHAAPAWAMDKSSTIKKIEDILAARGSRQGSKAH